jgi:tRNA uridine 5-carboxymethylaminomethyl modification enzyme
MVERFRRSEKIEIPESLDYFSIEGLSAEVREKLNKVRPLNLGQAARIPGVTPAAVAILSVVLRRS